MGDALQTPSEDSPAAMERLPRVLRHCQRCNGTTSHEIRGGIVVCRVCVECALNYDLDRD
jgi:hypothetical protein